MAILRGLALALAITATGMTAAMAEDLKCGMCEEWTAAGQTPQERSVAMTPLA
ncbi:hypothetical protein RBA41_15020 [Massilia sp. CCM 9210]|uniref:hypothetical protein n=1 Tax=Massilia scottii TaxID=3057166 RepID=UPI002796D3EE|nr:hypothetical protein [Massilia sp. CCM 9210]MDQ1814620.1 hypothetical protein [Massilia sp. CCM 9210]